MSLSRNLKDLSRASLVSVELTLENGTVVDTGAWPGSHLKNLNNFMDELDQYVGYQQIVKIKVDNYVISFE